MTSTEYEARITRLETKMNWLVGILCALLPLMCGAIGITNAILRGSVDKKVADEVTEKVPKAVGDKVEEKVGPEVLKRIDDTLAKAQSIDDIKSKLDELAKQYPIAYVTERDNPASPLEYVTLQTNGYAQFKSAIERPNTLRLVSERFGKKSVTAFGANVNAHEQGGPTSSITFVKSLVIAPEGKSGWITFFHEQVDGRDISWVAFFKDPRFHSDKLLKVTYNDPNPAIEGDETVDIDLKGELRINGKLIQ